MAETAIYRPTAFGSPVENQSDIEYHEALDVGTGESPIPETDIAAAINKFSRTASKGVVLRERAQWYWSSLQSFRARRKRNVMFLTGDQWGDIMQTDDGREITEAEYIKETNRTPVSFNQLDALIKNLVGQYRQNISDRAAFAKDRIDAQAAEMMTLKLRDTLDVNEADEIDVDQFREMLIAGIWIYKQTVRFNHRFERWVPKIERVNPDRFFFNATLEDPYTFDDLEFVGDFRDYRVEQVVDQFGGSDRARRRAIYEHYRSYMGSTGGEEYSYSEYGEAGEVNYYSDIDNTPPGRARLYEIWQREWRDVYFAHDYQYGSVYQTDLTPKAIKPFNEERMRNGQMPIRLQKMAAREMWVCYFVTPGGWILREMVTPYRHEEHPFIIGFTEYIDGSWYGLVDRIKEIQKFVNRLYSAIDFMMGAGAKGVLLIAKEHIPDGQTPEDFATEWREFGGVIVYNHKPGVELPKQVTANSVSAEWFNMLGMIKGEMRDISGVSSAMEGRAPTSGTPAERYQAEISQSSVNNLNFFHRFFAVLRRRDRALLQITLQSSHKNEYMSVPGQNRIVQYDPAKVRDIEWDVAMADVQQTAAHRQLNEEFLFGLVEGGMLSFDEWLNVSSHPASDKIKAARQLTAQMGIQTPQVGSNSIEQIPQQLSSIQQQRPTASVDDVVAQLAQLQQPQN